MSDKEEVLTQTAQDQTQASLTPEEGSNRIQGILNAPLAPPDFADFIRPICLLRPDWVQKPVSWASHIPFAFWLLERLRPATIVELGTHTGNSYFAFCQAASLLNLPTRLFAVDHWQGETHAGGGSDDVYEMVNRQNRFFHSFSTLLRMDFDSAVNQFADDSVDLLHIDGCHTYDAVKNDFERWLPKLSPGGIMILHDTEVRAGDFGVWRYWEELSAKYPGYNFRHGFGLGVIAPKGPCPALECLFRLSTGFSAANDFIASFFYELGQRLESGAAAAYNETVIYYDTGEGFVDHQICSCGGISRFHFRLPQTTAPVRRIKFVLGAEGACRVHMKKSTAVKGGICTPLEPAATNASVIRENDFYFVVPYPSFDYDITGLEAEILSFECEKFPEFADIYAVLSDAQTASSADQTPGFRPAALYFDTGEGYTDEQVLSLTGRDKFTFRFSSAMERLKQARFILNVGKSCRIRLTKLCVITSTGEAAPSISETTAILCEEDWYYFTETSVSLDLQLDPATIMGLTVECQFDYDLSRVTEAFTELKEKGAITECEQPHPLVVETVSIQTPSTPSAYQGTALEQEICQLNCKLDRLINFSSVVQSQALSLKVRNLLVLLLKGLPKTLFGGRKGLKNLLDYLYLKKNGFFNGSWYRMEYPDTIGLPPLWHFVNYGWREGRKPYVHFDTQWYLGTNPDVAESGNNPYVHYLRRGKSEGRAPNAASVVDAGNVCEVASDARLILPTVLTPEIEHFLRTHPLPQ